MRLNRPTGSGFHPRRARSLHLALAALGNDIRDSCGSQAVRVESLGGRIHAIILAKLTPGGLISMLWRLDRAKLEIAFLLLHRDLAVVPAAVLDQWASQRTRLRDSACSAHQSTQCSGADLRIRIGTIGQPLVQ